MMSYITGGNWARLAATANGPAHHSPVSLSSSGAKNIIPFFLFLPRAFCVRARARAPSPYPRIISSVQFIFRRIIRTARLPLSNVSARHNFRRRTPFASVSRVVAIIIIITTITATINEIMIIITVIIKIFDLRWFWQRVFAARSDRPRDGRPALEG